MNSILKSRKITFLFFISLFYFTFISFLSAQHPEEEGEEFRGCTNIMAGKKATTDGSVITSHSCDGPYRTWINIVPSKKFKKEEMKDIFRDINWGTMHTETSRDIRGIEKKGSIPQADETYAYLNTAYPCLNEKQLAMGESSIYGADTLRSKKGLFKIEELQRIALERCSYAREAILLIGKLAQKYGYADMGECLTIADKNEVWQFEIFGAGKNKIGAVWAAQRIPDDQVGICANKSRISEINLNKPDYFMASNNVRSLAKELNLWNPDSVKIFKFWKAYSGGRNKNFGIREYYVFHQLAPSLDISMEDEELPFSVKPDKKISVQDIMKFFRTTYEGTEFDMTKKLFVEKQRRRGSQENNNQDAEPDTVKSPAASPFMNSSLRRLINHQNPQAIKRFRTIAIAGCSYSEIIQCRDWLPDGIGGIAWLSFDNPAKSPRIPIFAGVLNLPKSFHICGQHRYRADAALWAFRRANRLSNPLWGRLREHIEKAVMNFEEKAFSELPMIEERAVELFNQEKNIDKYPKKYQEYLTRYTNNFARAAFQRWLELGDKFWESYQYGM